MYCHECGALLSDDVAFCTECGRAVGNGGNVANIAMEGNAAPTNAVETPATPHPSPSPDKKGKGGAKTVVVAIVVIAIIAIAVAVAMNAMSAGNADRDDASTNGSHDGFSTPANAYDIAGVIGMNPASMMTWLSSNDYTTYDGGGNSFARILIDGEETAPASDDPSTHTGWKTISVQMYTLLSSVPDGEDIGSLFDDNEAIEISSSELAQTAPRAATFVSTERAKDSGDLPKSTRDYLDRLISQAELASAATIEHDGDAYAIGQCEIDDQEGLWIAYTDKVDGSYDGFILCGYADDMEESLGIDGADEASLTELLGLSSSSSSSSSSISPAASANLQFNGITSANASSYFPVDSLNPSGYQPSNLIDGDTQHAWVEGASGTGAGEWVTLSGNGTQGFSGFDIWNGYQKSLDIYYKNARPSQISVFVDGQKVGTYELEDVGLNPQHIDFGKTYAGSELKIVIDSVKPGTRDEDCAISEIKVF